MRKSLAAAAMAASLTVGGAAGAALFVPSVSGAQEDTTTSTPTDDPAANAQDTRRPERGQFLENALAPLVQAGTIDQSQADAVIAALQEARPDRGPRGTGGRFGLGDGALTDVLGISALDLRTALADGQTIAEVAEANGVAVDDVIAALVSKAQERIDGAVADGRLTDVEAADKLADATQHATDLVNGDIDFGDRGRRGGPASGDVPADDADETTGS